ncbi:MAG: urea carboxylase [Acidobacteriota bacterium]
MFNKVLVANRGVIACRIFRTLRHMGVGSVAVYSEADRHSMHVAQADEAVLIGPAAPSASYLSMDAILNAALKTGATAIHPGYGFLSENAEFAERCQHEGIAFIGPEPAHLRSFGSKHTARELAAAAGVPLLPGTGLLADADEAITAARTLGYPVMLKSTAGGGGIGMRLCSSEAELLAAFDSVRRLSQSSFGNDALFLEKFVARARHIEVQVFGDGAGEVIALGERDCSTQRRNQKVIEETPAPGLSAKLRKGLLDAAVQLMRATGYRSVGTVEFIYDVDESRFYFLEVNTRLQVEHGVTEEVTGVNLVEWMVRLAAGEMPPLGSLEIEPWGCSIQVRLYAEDPANKFRPNPGRLSQVRWPSDARVETWVESGTEVTPHYDPMLAKIIVHGENRLEALLTMRQALRDCVLAGLETNLPYLRQVIADPLFMVGGVTTSYLQDFEYHRIAFEVLQPGTQTTVQDYPGRCGYWNVGVPPSGPLDPLAFRIANRILGNPESAAGLEIAVTGPTLRFGAPATIAVTGAECGAALDGVPLPLWSAVEVAAGSTLTMGRIAGAGMRAYLAIAGGIDVPEYMGSRSTFILGKFGGHSGRPLRPGDVLHYTPPLASSPQEVPADLIPQYSHEWEIGVMSGPHGAPDFFTPADMAMFFSTAWKVHHNSDRTGIRLIGPKPKWARKDGGEAGLHPSNIHDNAYAIGTVDFTGDMPVILGPDGPSLGGFVCPVTIIQAELWKMGQLRPADLVRFRPVSARRALQMERTLESCIDSLSGELPVLADKEGIESPVLSRVPLSPHGPAIVVRASGDRAVLVEYGPNVLDLNLRFRVHALQRELERAALTGVLDVTPGVRSLQIRYNGGRVRRETLLEVLEDCETRIRSLSDLEFPSRVVHLPLSWDDPATQTAIQRYMQSVRPDAPWCPSNIEFIRRINGLPSVEDVYRTVFDANYLVLGLGDVYLGAPVATPLDPRHRLVTTKYNPARTWTPENAVGIGGAYMCVYGMEGPGGYQFVGRTCQVWNTYRTTPEFAHGTPWLLRFFDQIRFYPVSAAELLEIRDGFPFGQYPLRIETQTFRPAEYRKFLSSIQRDAAAFKLHQEEAFMAERERWNLAGSLSGADMTLTDTPPPSAEEPVPEGCTAVHSPAMANVWKLAVQPGQRVEAGDQLMILEAMKMEIVVAAPESGVVQAIRCTAGQMVQAGQHLVTLRTEVR